MNNKKKPVVKIDSSILTTWDILEVIMPALKKTGNSKEADLFLSKIRSGVNFFDAINLAKKFVILKMF